MYYQLTEAIKRRFILELRKFWMNHPKYTDLVDNIQGKYSFRERPQYGIVLKASSANHVQLAADNFQGTVISYLHLAKYENYPGLSVEWVREDSLAVRANGGVFPSPPGIYYIDVTDDPDPQPAYSAERSFVFYVDPLLEEQNETATKVDDYTWQVTNPYVAGSTKVYEMPGGFPYRRDVNYTENPATGEVVLATPLAEDRYLLIDYRWPAPSTGPWKIKENYASKGAIPGCVLAFGRRVQAGDKFAVVVHSHRQPTAQEFGGKWEISLDFDIVARDPYAQQEIVDATVMYLYGVARSHLSTEGIEITEVSMGGETEEIYDENADDYFYNASFSVRVMADWAIHVPLSATIRRLMPQTAEQADRVAGMTDEELRTAEDISSIHVLESLGLRSFEDPFFVGKTSTFETLK